jgi:hypothetical protein
VVDSRSILMRAAGLGALAASFIVVGGANAQVPFNACLDRQDQPIQAVIDNALPYAGVATITVDGTPVILYNEQALSRTSPQGRRFVYLHECGHHALRHVWKDPSRQREMEADCWAIQQMVEQGIIKERKVDDLQAEIGTSRGLGSLKGCVEVKTDQDLWRRSLDLMSLAGAHKFDAIRGDPIVEAQERGFFESTLDFPGVFNCELTPEQSFSCEIFNGRDEGAARKHFDKVLAIIQSWLTDDWLTFERVRARPAEFRRFVAQDIQSGSLITLVATNSHTIRFHYQPTP